MYSENRKLIRLPPGQIRARPSCTVACGPLPQRWLGPCAQCTWPATPQRSAACERTPERSPLSWCTSRCGRWRCYCGGGGAKEGAQAPMVERPPAGHVGGGDSSPELLVDGKCRKTGMVTAFSDEVGGSGSRRVLRGSREGEEARLNNPQRKAARGGGGSGLCSPWRSSRRRRRPDSGGGALGQRRGCLRTRETARSGRSHATRGDSMARTAERRCRNGTADRRLYGTARARGSHAVMAH
jgi:hypothetical protein